MNSWKVFSLSIFLLIASIGHAQVMKSIMDKKVNYFSMDNTQKRADKRYVKPGTHILGFSVSNNQHPLILHDPSVLLKAEHRDRKSTRLNSSHVRISYAVFCLKKKKKNIKQ